MKTRIYQHRIHRRDLQLNPEVLYVFGDNEIRKGYGGQAAECRDEPNAVGIRTKRFPFSTLDDAYWSDNEYDRNCRMIDEDMQSIFAYDGVVVYPADGVGTGLSELDTRAPRTLAYLRDLGLAGV